MENVWWKWHVGFWTIQNRNEFLPFEKSKPNFRQWTSLHVREKMGAMAWAWNRENIWCFDIVLKSIPNGTSHSLWKTNQQIHVNFNRTYSKLYTQKCHPQYKLVANVMHRMLNRLLVIDLLIELRLTMHMHELMRHFALLS